MSQLPPRPPFWFRLSVTNGNLIEVAGLILGAVLLIVAAHIDSGVIAVVLMLTAWVVIYLCSHAFGHWFIGRVVGIHFRGYGIRGTDHPENYPPGMRQFMSALPFFTVMTEKESMARASRTAKALMFAAGETSTTLFSLAASGYAWRAGIPGGGLLFVISVVWSVAASIAVTTAPKGDYAKALHVLRGAEPTAK